VKVVDMSFILLSLELTNRRTIFPLVRLQLST